MVELYTEYLNYKAGIKQSVLWRFFKATKVEGEKKEKVCVYPDFDSLRIPANTCLEHDIPVENYVYGMHQHFKKFEQGKGKDGKFNFTCGHIGSDYKPSWQELKGATKPQPNPWQEIIEFLGLRPDVKIASRGIPLGFSLSAYDSVHDVSMKDIKSIDGNRYYLKNGTDHIAQYFFSEVDPFAFYVTPKNFDKYRELWNVKKLPLPSFEELKENGKELTRKQYDEWKTGFEKGSTI